MKTTCCATVIIVLVGKTFHREASLVAGFSVYRKAPRRSTSAIQRLPATTYFPSDWTDDEDLSGENGAATIPAPEIPSVLSTQAWTAPLARLAAGHWDGGGLQIGQINQVSVRAVAPSHVDIEAIVCEDEGCVSLSVPVPFAQPCGSGFGAKLEECILRNMQLLDDAQMEVSDGVLTAAEADALRSTDDIEYPQWWVLPQTLAMSRECSTLTTILNEPDFEADILSVARHEMRVLLGSDEGITLQRAAVAAVGPAGIVLRAFALYDGETEMVFVPVPFPATVTELSQMREAVLNVVESINPPAP
jgi:hypothetical protein